MRGDRNGGSRLQGADQRYDIELCYIFSICKFVSSVGRCSLHDCEARHQLSCMIKVTTSGSGRIQVKAANHALKIVVEV